MKQKASDSVNPSNSKRVKISEDRNVEYKIKNRSQIASQSHLQPKGVFKQVFHGSNNEEDHDEELFELEPMNKKRSKSFKADVYESDEEIDGPDSDDDTDEEQEGQDKKGVVGNDKGDDEDEDMFGDADGVEEKKAAMKKLQFLKSNDIEGQEWGEGQGDDENNGEIPTESFNMDQELAEGDFTQSGVYIRKKDEQSIHDSWLQGIGKKEIQKAKTAHAAKLQKDKDAEDNQKQIHPDKSLLEIFKLLQPSETILGAIKRLGAVSATVPKWKKVKKNAKTVADLTPEQLEANKKSLDLITSLATSLFDTNSSIYEMSYQDIAIHLQSVRLI